MGLLSDLTSEYIPARYKITKAVAAPRITPRTDLALLSAFHIELPTTDPRFRSRLSPGGPWPCVTYYLRAVVDDVHHAPVTDPDAPLIFVVFHLLHAAGRGAERRESISWRTRASTLSGNDSSSFRAEGLTSTE